MKKHIIFILFLGISQFANANDSNFAEFDSSFLQKESNKNIDLSDFYYGNPIKKGHYEFDIYVNGKNRGYTSIFIKEDSPNNDITKQLCITSNLVNLFDLNKSVLLSKECEELNSIIPYSSATINLSTLRLNISLPQAVVNNRPKDYVPPLLWEDGTSAGFLSYDYLNYDYRNNHNSNNSQYLSLRGGVNILGWNFRHSGSYSKNSNKSGSYTSYNTYINHDIDRIKGRLTIGNFITKNNFMDNFPIRGIQIASEKQMEPRSQRGFFPEIREIAKTNARIQIKQKNNIIYETVVPPGPFNINDLYSTPYNGDLEVSVLESDGSINKFIVPYSSSSNMLRPGNSEYQFSFGRYRSDYSDSDYISNISYQYGLNNILTINGGSILSSKYKSGIFGGGINLPIGSLSSNITYATSKIEDNKKTGYSLHADYSVVFDKTNTYLSFAAFKFSSKNYFNLDETMDYKNRNAYYLYTRIGAKSQYQINLNQTLPHNFGRLYLNASKYNYWNRDKKLDYIQLSYNNSYSFIDYSLGISTNIHKRDGDNNNTQISASISIPLAFTTNAPRLYSTINSSHHNNSNSSTISSSFGKNNEFNYSISNSNSNKSDSTFSASAGYRSQFANLSSSFSTSGHGNNQSSIGVSGGVVLHPYGITLANGLGESFAVIHADKGYGAKMNNSSNNTLDLWGNGIYNNLTPYEYNQVGVNIKDISADIHFKSTQKQVVPRSNSVLLINLETEYGPSALINLTRINGEPVPMGASVLLNGKNIGLVAQGGQIYLENIPDNSNLEIDWGDESCKLIYKANMAIEKNIAGFYVLNETCRD